VRDAETALLDLACAVASIGSSEAMGPPLGVALETLVGAHARDAALPRLLLDAALRARGDKAATLALAWAREQLRLSLQDVLEAQAKRGRVRDDVPMATLAWLLLAGCEATVHEPPGGADDRVAILLQLLAPPPAEPATALDAPAAV
jgi:hypothetical protein